MEKDGRSDGMLQKFNNMKIRERLIKAFFILGGTLVFALVISLIAMLVVTLRYDKALENYGFAQGNIGRTETEFAEIRSAFRGVIGYTEQSSVDEMLSNHDKYKEQFEKEFADLKDVMVASDEKRLYSEIESELDDYWKLEQEVLELGASSDEEDGKEAQARANEEVAPAYESIDGKLSEITERKVEHGDLLSNQLMMLCYILIAAILVIVIIMLLVTFKLNKAIIRGIVGPVNALKDRLVTFAAGDLSSPFPEVDTRDEIADMVEEAKNMAETLNFVIVDEGKILGEMANSNYRVDSEDGSKYVGDLEKILNSIHELRDQMVNTIRSIEEASSQVSAGSGNLAEASQSLAEGATEQAGAVQELQATITTITENIKSAAENAEESYLQAQKYSSEADNSREETKSMVESMERINENSQKIENIISEIEDIASQTNLLSLNASIEAARAGEAGRGFAVVADQISQLAEQSTKSAVETRDLIKGALQEIAEGNKAADRMAASIESVVEGIQKIAESSKSISTIATEQSVAMEQAEQGAVQISEVVQSNSAIAEEASATSEELSAQAISLDELISKFILPEN